MVGAGFSLNAEPLPSASKRFPMWRDLARAMFDEMHPPELGATAEPVLLHRPPEAEHVAETINADVGSDVDEAASTAALAIRHWTHLAALGHVPTPPPRIFATLVERVLFRRKPVINPCLVHLTYLVVERPEALAPVQADLLAASLIPWHHATILSAEDEATGEFHRVERPDLRANVAGLAGALEAWYQKSLPQRPEPPAIAAWRDWCASDPLPEVRRAFVWYETEL